MLYYRGTEVMKPRKIYSYFYNIISLHNEINAYCLIPCFSISGRNTILLFIIITRGWNVVFFFFITSTDVIALVEEIQKEEPLITASCKEHVIRLVQRLQEKLGEKEDHKFYLFKVRNFFKMTLEILRVSVEMLWLCFYSCTLYLRAKIWILWLISWVFFITSLLFRETELSWLYLSGIPPEGQRYNYSKSLFTQAHVWGRETSNYLPFQVTVDKEHP